ncbi:hypothetical protein EON65_48435 [archaeon]|nr:MAG: hypothetical protein EON65_48435 [archaeon]
MQLDALWLLALQCNVQVLEFLHRVVRLRLLREGVHCDGGEGVQVLGFGIQQALSSVQSLVPVTIIAQNKGLVS